MSRTRHVYIRVEGSVGTTRKEQVGSTLELTWQDLDIYFSHPSLRTDFSFFSPSEYPRSRVQGSQVCAVTQV